MRIAVFGTGAVGGYFGARLAQAGHDVVFIARGEHLAAMRREGLKVDSLAGDFVLKSVEATDRPAEAGEADVVLVGVKAWQVSEAAESMRQMVGEHTVVLPLQNGVEASSELSAILGARNVLGGLCGIIAYLVSPGHLCHAGVANPFVTFGELDNQVTSRVENLRRVFDSAHGVTASIAENIQVSLWNKFMLIVAWSGLGAVTRSPVGTFRSQPETRELLQEALREVYDVACARKIPMPPDSIASCLAVFDSLPADGTASMQRDIMNGVPSELEQQNGAVVRLGKEVGISTPVNSFIYASLVLMERRARELLEIG